MRKLIIAIALFASAEQSLAQFQCSACGGSGSSSGTMTSGTITVPSPLSVSPATITTSGTWAITWAAQSGPCSISSPNDGSSGTLTCRPLVALDIPSLAEGKVINLTTDLAAKAPAARLISTTAPLAGGGDLSADRILTISVTPANPGGAVALQASTPGTQQTGSLNLSGTVLAVALSGPLTGNVTGNVTGTSGSTTGNAATATALATARAINGVNFDGSVPITITAAGSTLSDTVPVAKGGTSGTSFTAYSLIAAGTTATGAFQSIGTGTLGQLMFSQGNAALGQWATRSVNTSSPLSGGGSIASDLTLTCSTCATTTNGGALSGTSPVGVSAGGAISCSTCATTTNGGALSATSPETISAAGVIACATCATTTNGGSLSATSPVTISAAGVIACSTCSTSGGVTNSAGNNVIPKSDGTNLVASTVTDSGSLFTVPEQLTLSNTTQLTERIRLAGQEFFQASNTDTNGFSLLMGVNRTGNRQPWFCDSAALTQNSSNACIWMLLGGTSAPQMGARATNGTTNLSFLLQPNGGNLGIGRGNSASWLLDVNGSQGLAGKMANYNAINTVSNGIPSEYGTADLTAQSAAISATTLYTPAATGMFRVSVSLQVTTAASVSSILAGTTGVMITYTDGDSSVAQSVNMALDAQDGTLIAVGTGNTGNTTGTSSHGQLIIYAKTGVAIQYAVGYSSTGVTAMVFAAHLKIEAL